MDCRRFTHRTLAACALLGLGAASASASGIGGRAATTAIPGNAEVLLDSAKDNLVGVYVNQPDANGVSHPDHVAQPGGGISGWNIKDVRLRYLQDSDTMIVGVNFFGIAGDADGDGIPGHASAATVAAGGVEIPHLGGQQSITVGFDTNLDGKVDVVAGVPASLPDPLDPYSKMKVEGAGTNGFLVAKATGGAIQRAYGDRLADHQGALLADPSAENPDFIFTVNNFSKLPGLASPYRFGLQAYAGSPQDIVAGEEFALYRDIRVPQPERVPEPSTLAVWTLLGAGAFWRAHRSRRRLAK